MYYCMVHCEQDMPVFEETDWWKTDVESFLNLSMSYRNGFDMEWISHLRARDNTLLSVLWSEDKGYRVIQTRS